MSTPEPQARDRRQLLLAPGAVLNGIDYVDVAAGQSRLSVHFLNTVTLKGSLSGSRPVTITGGEVVTSVSVSPIDETTDWSADSQGRPVLALTVTAPWDLSTYRLTISSGKLDPFFDQAPFSFTVNGPTMPDPAVPAPSSPEPAQEQVPIDYLAKDFASFQQALSEFSAQRYPAWVERSEADLGVMLMEVLAAMADELSYYQDRVLTESAIETATQRLSVVRHARLVDYEPAPATVATAILQLDVAGPPGQFAARDGLDDRHARAAAHPGPRSGRVGRRLRDRRPGGGPRRRRQHRPARLGDRRHPLEPGRISPPALLLGRQPALPARGLDRFLCRRP